MKLIFAAVLILLGVGPAFALDNSTKVWSRCKLDCDNTYPDNPNLNKICKAECEKNAVRAGKKATTKALDPNLPELTPDN